MWPANSLYRKLTSPFLWGLKQIERKVKVNTMHLIFIKLTICQFESLMNYLLQICND